MNTRNNEEKSHVSKFVAKFSFTKDLDYSGALKKYWATFRKGPGMKFVASDPMVRWL